jgi:diguanylate cyclase (GGDEF)-like protein
MQHMNSTRLNGTAHAAMATHAGMPELAGAAQNGTVDSAPYRLPKAPAGLEELKLALATSQEESNAARQQIDVYADTLSRLRQKVIRLEQEVAQVRHFAYHDELTGLPNRSLLLDRLNQAIVQAARQRKQVGLLLLDLDGFKSVNDRLGHATGDKLLQRVAERLLFCIRGADTACRYGGDEFVILLSEVDGAKSAAEVAQKLRAHLARPYVVDDHSIAVTASIGVAVYPHDGSSQNDLIRRADIAMYLAKARNNSPLRSLQPAARN